MFLVIICNLKRDFHISRATVLTLAALVASSWTPRAKLHSRTIPLSKEQERRQITTEVQQLPVLLPRGQRNRGQYQLNQLRYWNRQEMTQVSTLLPWEKMDRSICMNQEEELRGITTGIPPNWPSEKRNWGSLRKAMSIEWPILAASWRKLESRLSRTGIDLWLDRDSCLIRSISMSVKCRVN